MDRLELNSRAATLLFAKESPQLDLDNSVLFTRQSHFWLDFGEKLCLRRVAVGIAVFVLPAAIVLDLFATVLDFGEAKGGGGAFEEMALRGECGEIFFFSVG